MDFWTAVTSTIRHIHPLITDFPAAFLPLSVVLNLLSRKWPNLRQSAGLPCNRDRRSDLSFHNWWMQRPKIYLQHIDKLFRLIN
jgi:hypothetical protein